MSEPKKTPKNQFLRGFVIRKQDPTITPADILKVFEADRLEEVRVLVRSKLATVENIVIDRYVRSILFQAADPSTPTQVNEVPLRERLRGRKYVGEGASAPHMEGWLRRKGLGRLGLRRWNRRYFVLTKKTLTYRKPRGKDTAEIPPETTKSESVNLEGCRVFLRESYESKASKAARARAEKLRKKGDTNSSVPARVLNHHLICIQGPRGNTLCLLQAASRLEANEWITAIRKTIQMLPRAPVPQEDRRLKRAVWMAYVDVCNLNGIAIEPISSAKDVLVRIASHTIAAQLSKLEDMFDELALSASEETIVGLRKKASAASSRVIDEECLRAWHSVCSGLQRVTQSLPATVANHTFAISKIVSSYDQQVALAVKDRKCFMLADMMTALRHVCGRVSQLTVTACTRFHHHAKQDTRNLMTSLDLPATVVVHDPTHALWLPNYKGIIPATEIERLIRIYSVRLFQIPALVASALNQQAATERHQHHQQKHHQHQLQQQQQQHEQQQQQLARVGPDEPPQPQDSQTTTPDQAPEELIATQPDDQTNQQQEPDQQTEPQPLDVRQPVDDSPQAELFPRQQTQDGEQPQVEFQIVVDQDSTLVQDTQPQPEEPMTAPIAIERADTQSPIPPSEAQQVAATPETTPAETQSTPTRTTPVIPSTPPPPPPLSAQYTQQWISLLTQCCQFIGTKSRTNATESQDVRGLVGCLLAVIHPAEIMQALARLLQFSHQLHSYKEPQMNSAGLLEEWLVTVDYTFDMLKDEVVEAEPALVRLVERQACATKCMGASWPVDAMLAFSNLGRGLSQAVDASFNELEQTFGAGLDISITDQGCECQNGSLAVETSQTRNALNTAIYAALTGYVRTVAFSLVDIMLDVLRHVITSVLIKAHVHTPGDTCPLSFASNTEGLSKLPEELRQRLGHDDFAAIAINRYVARILSETRAETLARLEAALAEVAAAESNDLNNNSNHSSTSSSGPMPWGVVGVDESLEPRFVPGDKTSQIFTEEDGDVVLTENGSNIAASGSESDDSGGSKSSGD